MDNFSELKSIFINSKLTKSLYKTEIEARVGRFLASAEAARIRDGVLKDFQRQVRQIRENEYQKLLDSLSGVI